MINIIKTFLIINSTMQMVINDDAQVGAAAITTTNPRFSLPFIPGGGGGEF
jgi:hypothetical protein